MAKKYTSEEVLKIVGDYGYEILDFKYKNTKTKMRIRDVKDGYMACINLEYLIVNDGRIRLWHKTNPYSIYNINLYMKNNNINTYTLDKEYVTRNKTLMSWVCSICGKTYECRLDHILSNKKDMCNECSRIVQDDKRREDKDYLMGIFTQKGLTPMVDRFYTHESIPCCDSNGYIYYCHSYSVRKDDYVGKIVDTKNPYTIHNIKRYIELNNLTCKLISDNYVSANEKLRFKCECGEIYETSWNTLREYNKQRCDVCTGSMSNGEYLVMKLLKSKNIIFKMYERIDECRMKRALPFDFIIFDNKDRVLATIEVDGIQHYEPIEYFGGEKSFERQVLSDEIKNTYCNDNNIPLLRISHIEIDSGEYIYKLENFIKQNIFYV